MSAEDIKLVFQNWPQLFKIHRDLYRDVRALVNNGPGLMSAVVLYCAAPCYAALCCAVTRYVRALVNNGPGTLYDVCCCALLSYTVLCYAAKCCVL
jgi:hypothetical protein